MKYLIVCAGVVGLLTACATTSESEVASARASASISAPVQSADTPAVAQPDSAAWSDMWTGTWSGSWGGTCTGSIKVSNVTATRADVVYSWGVCGNSRPGSTDTFGAFQGNTLVVNLWGRTTARYTHISDDALRGIFNHPASEVQNTSSGSGDSVFTRS